MPAPKEKAQPKTPSAIPATSGNAVKSPVAPASQTQITNKQSSVPSPSLAPNSTGNSTRENAAEGSASKRVPTREEIELAAYLLFLERGGIEGYAVDDWLQAERELIEGTEAQRKARAKSA